MKTKAQNINFKKINLNNRFNLGLNAQKSGNISEAKIFYQEILAEFPNHFDSLHMLGLISTQTGDLAEAEELLAKAIRLNPNFAAAHSNQGNLLKILGRPKEALASFDRAIALNPQYAIAHSNRGLVLQDMNRSGDALISFRNAIRINPALREAHYNRGVIFLGLGKLDEAITSFSSSISLKPDYVNALFNRGNALKAKGDLLHALTDYELETSLAPHHAKAYSNKGLVLQELGRPNDAITSYTRAISIEPEFAEAYNNRGNSFKQVANREAAILDYTKALVLKPDYPDAVYNRGVLNLMLGNYSSGWTEYESRSKVETIYRDSIVGHADISSEFSVMNSRADFLDSAVFVASEQGIGDQIMFASIVSELLNDADRVICQLDQRLIRLFSRCFPGIGFVPRGDVSILDRMQIDRLIRIGSLGYTYRQDINSFSGLPYLTPDPMCVARWQSRMATDPGKRKVGVSWRGGSTTTNGQDRSMTLEQLSPILDRKDCTFVSLQYGEVGAEIDTFNANRANKLNYFPKQEIDDFEDFAGLIGALDCVISVQNTTVHTCGALGKPCFTMLPFNPEWRYGASGHTMPWYRSVKLFRQLHKGEWSDVIDAVFEAINLRQ